MILLVGFYQDAHPARTEELVKCAQRNAENPSIERLDVFIEDRASVGELRARFPALSHAKVRLVEHGRRLTYAELFEHANRHLAGATVIVANADIFFDDTLALLRDEPLSHRMLCLSRWDEGADGVPRHLDRPDSQDAWIFEAPLPRIACDFFLGVPGCDNRLAFEAERAGLAVSNPSRSVRARHLHRSEIRRYTQKDRLAGPTRFVPASFLDTVAGPVLPARPPEAELRSHRGRRAERIVDARCREIEALLAPYLGPVVPRALQRELRRTIAARTDEPRRPTDAELATVAFRESMGYTLARLEPGASTHNNHPRPLVSVPPALMGLPFTQVVANRAGPVEVEFRTKGMLFVLAAPGWEGYAPASAFLDDAGWREAIEPLRASEGTTFQAWSIVGDAGERFVAPTQVMLASRELVRLG